MGADQSCKCEAILKIRNNAGSLSGADKIEITSGVTAGDMIVTAGLSSLVEGKEIIPITEVSY